mgnify:FL=1
MKPWVWDYELPDDWEPKTDDEWEWYLVRKINYEDLKGLTRAHIQKYFPSIERYLDPGKRVMIDYYLKH